MMTEWEAGTGFRMCATMGPRSSKMTVGCTLRGQEFKSASLRLPLAWLLLLIFCAGVLAQNAGAPFDAKPTVPPRVSAARRFLARRGLKPGQRPATRRRGQRGTPIGSAA